MNLSNHQKLLQMKTTNVEKTIVTNLMVATKIVLEAINSKSGITKSELGRKLFQRRYELLLGSGSNPRLLFDGLVVRGKIRIIEGDRYELTSSGVKELNELPELPEVVYTPQH